MKMCLGTNNDIYSALLQIYSMPIGPGLLTLAALLVSRSIRGLIPKLCRLLILFDHYGDYNAALIERKWNADKNKDTHKSSLILSAGMAAAAQHEDGSHGHTSW